MPRDMSPREIRAFLTEGTRTGKLATTRASGAPHVAPIWFVLDGDDIILTTGVASVKGKTIARDSRVALCVDDERPPFAFVMIEGTATLSADPDELLLWATRIGARYMGEEKAAAFGRRNAVPDERLVRITSTKIVSKADMAL